MTRNHTLDGFQPHADGAFTAIADLDEQRSRRPARRAPALSLLAASAVAAVAVISGLPSTAGAAPTKAATTIVVTVTAGKPSEFGFALSKKSVLPWVSTVPSGSVTFKVTNRGMLPHNFKVCLSPATTAALNTCNGTSTKLLSPGQSTSLTIAFTRRGKYEYLCTVPGHAAAGMKGLIGIGVKV